MLTWKKHTFNISRLKSFEGQQTISQSVRASFKSLLSSCITCRPDQTAIIAESLILPAASNMWKTMFGKEEYVKKTEKHPFAFFPPFNWWIGSWCEGTTSRETPESRLFCTTIRWIHRHVKRPSVFSVCVVVYQNEMQEEFIFCKQLHGRTTKFRDFHSDRQFFP